MSFHDDEMLCLCVGLTEGQIKGLIKNGNASFEDLRLNFDIGEYCGSCRRCVKKLCEEYSDSEKEENGQEL